MSKTAKIILWIVVAIIVIGGIWWWMSYSSNESGEYGNTPAPAGQTYPTGSDQGSATSTGPAANVSDNSDAALNADLSNIDAQMNGYSSDTATVNAGLNDQPISQ